MLLSLLLPPLVIGLLLVFMVGPYTPIGELIGHLHLTATNTFLALVIAEVYESAPYYVVGAQAAFAAVDPRLEQQAELLGDRPRRVFRRVTLPLAAPGLAMALAVAWARAMGAFGAVVIIAYHPYGIPLQIFTTLQETGLPSALPLCAGPAGGGAAAAAGRLYLERPCWTPTSRLTGGTSPCAPPCRWRQGSGWPCSAPRARARPRCSRPLPGWSGRAAAGSCWAGGSSPRPRPRPPRCRPGSGGSACCARIPACSRTCRCGPTCATRGPPAGTRRELSRAGRHPRPGRAAHGHARPAVRRPGAPGGPRPAAAGPLRRPAAGRALHRAGREPAPVADRPGRPAGHRARHPGRAGRARAARRPGLRHPAGHHRLRRPAPGRPAGRGGAQARVAAGG